MKKRYAKRHISRWILSGLILVGLGFSLWGTAPFYLPLFAKFLHIEIPLDHAEVGVVLSGDTGERVVKAVELYKAKKIEYLLMSGGPTFRTTMAKQMKAYAQELGVPAKKIWMEDRSSSTYENAVLSRKELEKRHVRSIVIITSNYHTRRSHSIFKKAFKNSSIKIGVAGAKDEVDPNIWWKRPGQTELVVLEWVKTIVYWFKGPD